MKGFNPESGQTGERFAHLYPSCHICVSAAAESERGEGLHRECGQEAGHHGPADQVHRKLSHSLSRGFTADRL